GSFKNGSEVLKACRDNPPDVLILDIEMPVLTGFDVVKRLQADDMPSIIFATAYDNYAIDAFDLNAVDYLLKPFDSERFAIAVERVRTESRSDSSLKGRLISASRQIQKVADDATPVEAERTDSGRLAVRDGRETELVTINEIDWVDAAGDYMCLHVGGKTHIMRSTMKELLAKLPEKDFVRIHRSTIVNIHRVNSVSSLSKGEFRLQLGSETSLKVSRNYRKSIASLLS
ncbi:MAG: LytTR family DNA-binding domain-containing protein, partial [Pseudomonadota bacterium]|nr:LytTR family DNA-binding domain-containing protein [Pseudomonadota bacterium]